MTLNLKTAHQSSRMTLRPMMTHHHTKSGSSLVPRAQSTTKDYVRAEHKLHSISKLFMSQVIIPYVMFVCFFSLFLFRGHSTREPASSTVTYFILRAYTGTGVSHSQHGKTSGEVLDKNAGKWTGRVEISKEEILVSKRTMYSYILNHSRL